MTCGLLTSMRSANYTGTRIELSRTRPQTGLTLNGRDSSAGVANLPVAVAITGTDLEWHRRVPIPPAPLEQSSVWHAQPLNLVAAKIGKLRLRAAPPLCKHCKRLDTWTNGFSSPEMKIIHRWVNLVKLILAVSGWLAA